MIVLPELDERSLRSPLGRVSPLVKLGLAIAWLVGLAFTLDPRPPLALAAAAAGAGIVVGGIAPGRLARAVIPLWSAALGIACFNALFSVSNGDPLAPVALAVGPVRVTEAAAGAGLALGLRVLAIATVGVVFGLTTDSTGLVDSLVQQARVSERFGYGALAAYQAIPRLAEDLATLRQARRIRGLAGTWHPRLLVGLLVLAIRHGDRLALAMDARAFGSGVRSRYRPVAWAARDLIVGCAGLTVLAVALLLGRA